jgi:hypothetical protein
MSDFSNDELQELMNEYAMQFDKIIDSLQTNKHPILADNIMDFTFDCGSLYHSGNEWINSDKPNQPAEIHLLPEDYEAVTKERLHELLKEARPLVPYTVKGMIDDIREKFLVSSLYQSSDSQENSR